VERGAYRLGELGSYQFKQLCVVLLELGAGLPATRWRDEEVAPGTAYVPEGLTLPGRAALEGPRLQRRDTRSESDEGAEGDWSRLLPLEAGPGRSVVARILRDL
jgi:hypothetical protein